ncbi:Alpha/Beta hydrolase protein [Hyaloraphidium curvatum]|nr:Alpha/Beta hydrolase protein [Hyaloraphidium curvatum]
MLALSRGDRKFCCVAMDLAGHGLSDHRHASSPYSYTSFASDVLSVAEALGWDRYALLGHSLGAAIGALVAAAFPERIQALCMIDNIGPLSRPPGETVAGFRKHHLAAVEYAAGRKRKPVYDRIEDAITARQNGLVPMTYEGAKMLVERGTEVVAKPDGTRGWTWRTDQLLLLPNAMNFTEESVLAILGAIASPTLVIIATGQKAWLLTTFKSMTEKRMQVLREHHDPSLFRIVELEGSHHLMLEGRERECAEGAYGFFKAAIGKTAVRVDDTSFM